MLEETFLNDKQIDHLLLLVGGNPLPNYVVGKMFEDKHPKLHFMVTDQVRKSKDENEYANRLADVFQVNYKIDSNFIPVKPSNPLNIYQQVKNRVIKLGGNWMLHYTGGTKSMAALAFLGVLDGINSLGNKAYFAYLDAKTMMMIIHSGDGEQGHFYASKYFPGMSLKTLLFLHGQPKDLLKKIESTLEESRNSRKLSDPSPHSKPFHPNQCPDASNLMLSAWQDYPQEMRAWTEEFIGFELSRAVSRIGERNFTDITKMREELRLANRLAGGLEGGKVDPYSVYSENLNNNQYYKWKKRNQLAQWEKTQLPKFLAEQYSAVTIKELADLWEEETDKVAVWLHGAWLEDYVFSIILKIKEDSENGIGDVIMGLEPNLKPPLARKETEELQNKPYFESDIIFLKNYQLFYISITTDASSNLNKSKAFEAYVRARQLGGDEAKIGLVTFYPNPLKLEADLSQPLEKKAIQVFGPDHLKDLKYYLERWIK